MADNQPSTLSGGQSDSPDVRNALGQPVGALELNDINSTQPSVPAKDGPTATEDPDSSISKGKEKEVSSPSSPPDRTDSLSIGAAESPVPAVPNPDEGPVCNIVLLLPTGARHPYKIDDRYLTKRNVEVPDITENGKKDPFSVSVYKLKELILREWRDEWDGKPASPSSIRLIHFGKLLDDKEQLNSECFPMSYRLSTSRWFVKRLTCPSLNRVPIQPRGTQRCSHVRETGRDGGRG